MQIEEVLKKAEVHAHQLAVVNERAHRERKYHDDGEVCNVISSLFPVLAIYDMQYRVYRRCDLRSLRVLETRRRSSNGHPTRQVYAAEIEGGAVTVVMKLMRSETMDEILALKNSPVSMDEDDSLATDWTLLKRLL